MCASVCVCGVGEEWEYFGVVRVGVVQTEPEWKVSRYWILSVCVLYCTYTVGMPARLGPFSRNKSREAVRKGRQGARAHVNSITRGLVHCRTEQGLASGQSHRSWA